MEVGHLDETAEFRVTLAFIKGWGESRKRVSLDAYGVWDA